MLQKAVGVEERLSRKWGSKIADQLTLVWYLTLENMSKINFERKEGIEGNQYFFIIIIFKMGNNILFADWNSQR